MAASSGPEARDESAFAAAPSSLRLKVPRFDDGARDGQHGNAHHIQHSHVSLILVHIVHSFRIKEKTPSATSPSTRVLSKQTRGC